MLAAWNLDPARLAGLALLAFTYVSPQRAGDPLILRLWCGYVALAGAAVLGAVCLPGRLAGT